MLFKSILNSTSLNSAGDTNLTNMTPLIIAIKIPVYLDIPIQNISKLRDLQIDDNSVIFYYFLLFYIILYNL